MNPPATPAHAAAPTPKDAEAIGARIRTLRTDKGLTLTELAERAHVSKSYLSTVENGTGTRPGAAILHRLAVALGVTLGDLLGRDIQASATPQIPPSLRQFADEHGIPQADIEMLAGIKFRGEAPRNTDSWKFIYNAIVMSVQSENRQT